MSAVGDEERSIVVTGVTAAGGRQLGLHPCRQVEPGIFVDPDAPAYYFVRCKCGLEAAAVTLGRNGDPKRRRGARGLQQSHDEFCGYGERSVSARQKAREAAFGKGRRP